MNWYNKLLKLGKLREALVDEESKKLFDARIEYLCTRNEDNYLDIIHSIPKTWHCKELDSYLNGQKEIIIFGCGYDGMKQKKVLDLCNITFMYWCDNNDKIVGTKISDKLVLSVDEVVEKHRDSLIIIGSRKYGNEMYNDLIDKNFPSCNILQSEYGILVANCGKQYFDVFEPVEGEVFVDAGAYNGDTILDYFSWVNGKNKKVYTMEPLKEMADNIELLIKDKQLNNVIVKNMAAWNKEDQLMFSEGGSGSYINEKGETIVNAIDIDTMVGNDKVTYIKMDIEGAEFKALQGARKTIIRDSPKLAICIYHRPEDIVLLGEYLLELNPAYRMYIRHYASNMWETVLYAFPPV